MLEAAASIARRQSYGDGKPHLSSVMKLLKEVTAHENTLVLGTVLRSLEAPALSQLTLGAIHCSRGFQESDWKSLFDSEDFRSFKDRTPGFSLSVDNLEDDRVYELLESS